MRLDTPRLTLSGVNNNLPALDVLLNTLDGPSRTRWQRHVDELEFSACEQTSQGVQLALHRGDVDGALYEVIRARLKGRVQSAPQEAPQVSIARGSKSDEAIAAAISALSARRASADGRVNVRLLRESIIGRAEPLSRTEAWAFLDKAERHPHPIPWERLHAGWDRSPLMSQTQIGAHASLSFRDEAGRDHQFRAGPESVLGSLWLWANHLFTTYNWPRSQAAWFLLTGEPPTLLPATALIEQGVAGALTSTITVTVPGYGGKESVAAALTMASRQLLGRRRGPLALARHAMAAFVDDQFEREGKPPEWQELWRRWNQFAPPQWRLRKGRVRYPHWSAMLDAYRREKQARGEIEARDALAREREARLRYPARDKEGPRARKRKVPASRGRTANDHS